MSQNVPIAKIFEEFNLWISTRGLRAWSPGRGVKTSKKKMELGIMLSKYEFSVEMPGRKHQRHSHPASREPPTLSIPTHNTHWPPQDKQIIGDDVRLMLFGEWKSRWQVAEQPPISDFPQTDAFPSLIPHRSSKCFRFVVQTNGNLSALISAEMHWEK